jgi:hypothetical protein
MKPSCDNCWIPVLNKKTIATRLALTKLGVTHVWVALMNGKDCVSARKFRERHKDDLTPVLHLLSTYNLTNDAGVLSTVDMVPSRELMKQVTLEEGLKIWHQWGLDYRPKRVRADWDLRLLGSFEGKFIARPATISKLWKVMGQRWGYKPGDPPDDVVAFERRMYLVLEEIRNGEI